MSQTDTNKSAGSSLRFPFGILWEEFDGPWVSWSAIEAKRDEFIVLRDIAAKKCCLSFPMPATLQSPSWLTI